VKTLGKHTNLLSRLLQLTALIFFIFAVYRLYRYFTNWLNPPAYMIYAIFAAAIVGVSILIFDDVFKPGADFVGWAFLFGAGVFSLLTGLIFTFYPEFITTNPFTGIWLRAFFFLIMGIIVIIESFLVRREVVKTDHGLVADTVGPVILKFAATFGLAWGSYQMAWVLVPYLRGVLLTNMMPLFLSALGFIFVSVVIVSYIETQNRQPHFRYRRFPLLMSFLLLLMIFPVTTFYIVVFVEFTNYELLFNAILGLVVNLTILCTSLYIVYHPTKAR
jgi:hypothetical protein